MIIEITPNMEMELYHYFVNNLNNVPYYFTVTFDDWRKSMFEDCGYDGQRFFKEMKTFLLINEGILEGFIQFGLTAFRFSADGQYDHSNNYAIIRNLHYMPDAKNPESLMDLATSYFADKNITKKYAFFHFFGMSCYARQGKLYDSNFYIEDLLSKYGYSKEHENIYYSKKLQHIFADSSEITTIYTDNGKHFEFYYNGEMVGGGDLNTELNSNICYLIWIYVNKELRHQGIGTKCMNKLFYDLSGKGFSRIDTDTADTNVNAQGYYTKTGFENKGIMRSYFTL